MDWLTNEQNSSLESKRTFIFRRFTDLSLNLVLTVSNLFNANMPAVRTPPVLACELFRLYIPFNKFMRSSNLTRILGILLVAVIAGGLIGWWASRNAEIPKAVVTANPVQPVPPANETEPTPPPIAQIDPAIPVPVDPGTNTADEPTWEDKLDEILTSDSDTTKKGEDLLDMMPKVNAEAQVELAGHIVNLVDDAHYARVAPYLTNASVPEAVSSVFMNDLYNRENSVKLPLVLAVARTENHPLVAEARDLLELYLEEDHGSDWAAWETAMQKWLQENPDEEK